MPLDEPLLKAPAMRRQSAGGLEKPVRSYSFDRISSGCGSDSEWDEADLVGEVVVLSCYFALFASIILHIVPLLSCPSVFPE